MALTRAERAGGKLFLALAQEMLAARDQGMPVPTWVRYVRHECTARWGISATIDVREHYLLSPEYWGCYCGVVGTLGSDFPHEDCDGGKVIAPAGFFIYLWKEGKCSACGEVARSGDGGHLFLRSDREPAHRAKLEELHD